MLIPDIIINSPEMGRASPMVLGLIVEKEILYDQMQSRKYYFWKVIYLGVLL